MTETTARIRWEPTAGGGFFGHVGTRGTALFKVWQPSEDIGTAQPWALKSDWSAGYTTGTRPDELKAEAERWLEQFASSLGAVFPEPGRVAVNEAALEEFVGEARSAWDQRDQEFCVGAAEYERSAAEFDALVTALGIPDAPETSPTGAEERNEP